MELTDEQLEFIRAQSREVDYGHITINFGGSAKDVVMNVERCYQFHHEKAQPSLTQAMDRRRGGRY